MLFFFVCVFFFRFSAVISLVYHWVSGFKKRCFSGFLGQFSKSCDLFGLFPKVGLGCSMIVLFFF